MEEAPHNLKHPMSILHLGRCNPKLTRYMQGFTRSRSLFPTFKTLNRKKNFMPLALQTKKEEVTSIQIRDNAVALTL